MRLCGWPSSMTDLIRASDSLPERPSPQSELHRADRRRLLPRALLLTLKPLPLNAVRKEVFPRCAHVKLPSVW